MNLSRILVAEDDDSVREIVAEVLRDDGFEVVEARSGTEALDLFRQQHFSLVLSDVRMPGLNGLELLQRIKDVRESAQFLIMTSHSSVDSARAAIKNGAADYLVKPFESLEEISEAVRKALEKARSHVQQDELIRKLSSANQELERVNYVFRSLAVRDGLTGLFNRRYFNESLASEVDRAKRYDRDLSLVFIDVDHFKLYNDTHGHQRGDLLLRELSLIMRKCTRETDVVARWGGEEFAILAPETSLEKAMKLAESLRDTFERFPIEGSEAMPGGMTTISVGVSSRRPHDNDKVLVERADRALYQAKADGRNCIRAARSECGEDTLRSLASLSSP